MMLTEELHDFLKRSLLYQERLAEQAEILKHKWIESEKAGHDIGLDRATTDWHMRYSSSWRNWRRSQRHPQGETPRTSQR